MSRKFFPPYRVGDVVGGGRCRLEGEAITKVNIYGVNNYEYATTHRAWLKHKTLVLLRPCDAESIKDIIKREQEN